MIAARWPYLPGRGGTLTNKYSFQPLADPCATQDALQMPNKTNTAAKLLILAMMAIPSLTGCSGGGASSTSYLTPAHLKRMAAENVTRASIGLREIQITWHLYSVEFNEENWKVVPADAVDKKLHRDGSGKIIWEEDYYYSGRTFIDFKGGQVDEQLTIHYDYTSSTLYIDYVGEDPAIETLVAPMRPGSAMPRKSMFSAADTVLKKWGLSRL